MNVPRKMRDNSGHVIALCRMATAVFFLLFGE